jgi:phosphate transport system substrate-binding protein
MRMAQHAWWKATLLVAIVAGLAVFALACGDDEGDDDGTTTPSTSTAGGPGTSAAGGEELSGELEIEGSSTVAPYTRLAIEAFEAEHPDVTITTGELGSGGGITAFIEQQVPLAAASRAITDDETAQAEAAGLEVHETKIFDDALVIVVNPANSVGKLSVQQVARIFAGEIKTWEEVGGSGGDITIYTRNEESGTFAYMEEEVIQEVLGDDAQYSPDVNKQANAPAGLTAVAGDPSGIFYAGLGNVADLAANQIKVVSVSADASGEGVVPSEESVASGDYPIARGLFYYTDGDPADSDDPILKAFIEFVLSDEGQALGAELGFVPAGN